MALVYVSWFRDLISSPESPSELVQMEPSPIKSPEQPAVEATASNVLETHIQDMHSQPSPEEGEIIEAPPTHKKRKHSPRGGKQWAKKHKAQARKRVAKAKAKAKQDTRGNVRTASGEHANDAEHITRIGKDGADAASSKGEETPDMLRAEKQELKERLAALETRFAHDMAEMKALLK